jgi:hypothetical protein
MRSSEPSYEKFSIVCAQDGRCMTLGERTVIPENKVFLKQLHLAGVIIIIG